MNPLLERIYKESRVEDSEGNFVNPFPVSITYEKGLTLYKLIRDNRLDNSLEIGMAYDLSSLFICQAHRDKGAGAHASIDPLEDTKWNSIGLLNIRRAGLEEILKFYESPSYEVLPRLLADGESFDFVFVDGSHFFDYALLDFFYADKLLKGGGYIMFDDLLMPSIKKVLAFILLNRRYELLPNLGAELKNFSPVRRLVKGKMFKLKGTYCVIRKISDDDRELEHYKEF